MKNRKIVRNNQIDDRASSSLTALTSCASVDVEFDAERSITLNGISLLMDHMHLSRKRDTHARVPRKLIHIATHALNVCVQQIFHYSTLKQTIVGRAIIAHSRGSRRHKPRGSGRKCIVIKIAHEFYDLGG